MSRFSGKIGKGGQEIARTCRRNDAEERAKVPYGDKLPSGKDSRSRRDLPERVASESSVRKLLRTVFEK